MSLQFGAHHRYVFLQNKTRLLHDVQGEFGRLVRQELRKSIADGSAQPGDRVYWTATADADPRRPEAKRNVGALRVLDVVTPGDGKSPMDRRVQNAVNTLLESLVKKGLIERKDVLHMAVPTLTDADYNRVKKALTRDKSPSRPWPGFSFVYRKKANTPLTVHPGRFVL